MPYVVFDVKKENEPKIKELLKDDLVSRQSILIREAKVLDIKDHEILVFIEGDKKALEKAEELFSDISKKLDDKARDEAYKKIKDEEGEVLGGVGLIFKD